MTRFNAAVLQMRSGVRPEANAEAFETLVRAAAAEGADYVQSPEMTGMVQRDRDALFRALRGEGDDLLAKTAARLAHELAIHVHLGSVAVALDDGKVANRSLLFAPSGETIASYDKIHMFDVDLDGGESWRESRTYRPGESACVADLDVGGADGGKARLGLSICYDLRFPHLFREEALSGAEVLAVPAAFTRQTGEAHWHVLLRARAIENGAFVVAAAQGGRHEDGRHTFGYSLIVDPWGAILAEVDGEEPGFAIAAIDTDAVREARGKVPNLKNARSFGLGDGRWTGTGAA